MISDVEGNLHFRFPLIHFVHRFSVGNFRHVRPLHAKQVGLHSISSAVMADCDDDGWEGCVVSTWGDAVLVAETAVATVGVAVDIAEEVEATGPLS